MANALKRPPNPPFLSIHWPTNTNPIFPQQALVTDPFSGLFTALLESLNLLELTGLAHSVSVHTACNKDLASLWTQKHLCKSKISRRICFVKGQESESWNSWSKTKRCYFTVLLFHFTPIFFVNLTLIAYNQSPVLNKQFCGKFSTFWTTSTCFTATPREELDCIYAP